MNRETGPIVSLQNKDRDLVLAHLLRLNSADRYMRFFAVVNDDVITAYVNDAVNFKYHEGYGIFSEDRTKLIAFAHLVPIKVNKDYEAELGISVDREYRSLGLAKKLMDRVIVHCNAANINRLYMSCLHNNSTMQHIARSAGLKVVVDHDQAIGELHIHQSGLPKPLSVSCELLYEQISIFDKCYRINKLMVGALFDNQSSS